MKHRHGNNHYISDWVWDAWNDFMDNLDWILPVIACIVVLIFIGLLIAGMIMEIPQLSEGVVLDKRYDPPHTSYRMGTWSDGEIYANTFHYRARWEILVNGVKDDGEERAEWWDIGEALYERIDIGDRVRRTSGGAVFVEGVGQ